MIFSASRRTDIPCHYGEWMIRRLRQGEVVVPNPYRPHRLTRLIFSPQTVDAIVFWTKHPASLLPHLEEIRALGYSYLFQYSLTPYGPNWEEHLPATSERIRTLQSLGAQIGKERVIWRYDPILLDETCTIQWHEERFAWLCDQLSGYVAECVLSFVDIYPHLRGRMRPITSQEMERLAAGLSQIAAAHGLTLRACCEAMDLAPYDILPGACIDQKRLEGLLGCPLTCKRDAGQRPGCGCVESVDIGVYNTCTNGCRYCYATRSGAQARYNALCHDPDSPMLLGRPGEGDVLVEKVLTSCRSDQTRLF